MSKAFQAQQIGNRESKKSVKPGSFRFCINGDPGKWVGVQEISVPALMVAIVNAIWDTAAREGRGQDFQAFVMGTQRTRGDAKFPWLMQPEPSEKKRYTQGKRNGAEYWYYTWMGYNSFWSCVASMLKKMEYTIVITLETEEGEVTQQSAAAADAKQEEQAAQAEWNNSEIYAIEKYWQVIFTGAPGTGKDAGDGGQFGLTEAYHIGPAYFKDYDPGQTAEEEQSSRQSIWDERIEPILREYVRGRDWEKGKGFLKKCADAFGTVFSEGAAESAGGKSE